MSPPIIENEQDRLASVYSLGVLDTPPEPEFDDLVELAAWTCHAPIAALSLIDEDRQWFKAGIGLDTTETARAVAFCSHTIAEQTTLVVSDARNDDRFSENPFVTGASGVRFYAGVPVVVDEGLSVGTLCVLDTRPRPFFADERRALEIIARQAGLQLRGRRLEASARDHLTGTATSLASDRWLRLQSSDTTRAAIHVDIDGFAEVNRRHGRATGDWILGITGERLRTHAPQDSLIVRLGDDDFAVLVDDADDADLQRAVEDLRESLEAPIGDVALNVSFGLATARPGNDGADLIEAASRATRLEKQLRATG